MNNARIQLAAEGRREVLHCFVENALALDMEPAMVALIADSSDPFVLDMIAAPDTAQRRTPDVDFFATCATNPNGTINMTSVIRVMEAQGAKKEVYRLARCLATKDRFRALRETLPNICICRATAEIIGIAPEDFVLIYTEEDCKAKGEQEATELIAAYMEGEEISDLAERHLKTEAEVVELLEKAGVYAE